jgi:pyridoxamine 5'-phosphate oxidase
MPFTGRNIDIDAPPEPWDLFKSWFSEAETHEPDNTNAMALATVGPHGMPAVRMVLMKGYDEKGFTFFTNLHSAKGESLTRHPKAAINFHWKSLQRQVRAEGNVVQVSAAESDAYFATRSRGSKLGAWASRQSSVLESRATLEQRVLEFDRSFGEKPIPRPPHWGGFRLEPVMIEFWQEREFRLHDRLVYHRADLQTGWTFERLYP